MYAEKKCWNEVFNGLYDHSLMQKDMPNAKPVYEAYLKELGWVKQPMPRFPDNTRYTLKEFIDQRNFGRGIVIVSVAKHLTVIDGKDLIDTWDCSHKSVGNYWTKG